MGRVLRLRTGQVDRYVAADGELRKDGEPVLLIFRHLEDGDELQIRLAGVFDDMALAFPHVSDVARPEVGSPVHDEPSHLARREPSAWLADMGSR